MPLNWVNSNQWKEKTELSFEKKCWVCHFKRLKMYQPHFDYPGKVCEPELVCSDQLYFLLP